MLDTFRVGLLLTEQCNIECSHCWFSSGPDRRVHMELDEALDYIDQIKEIPSVKWISFTGGEPFLLPEMLVSVVDFASKRGFQTECVTNCFWAETEEGAVARLRELVDVGLNAINISADDFHQRHIPFRKVSNCYWAARRLGLKVVIMCAMAKSSTLRVQVIVRRLGDEGIHIVGEREPKVPVSALAVETGFTPVGRAAEIPKDEWLIGNSPVGGPCRVVLRDIGIAPDGRVLPCCSAASQVEYAAIGNAKEDRIGKLVEKASQRPLFKILSREGPSGLAKLLGSKILTGYVGRCHLCHGVLTDPGLRHALLAFQPS